MNQKDIIQGMRAIAADVKILEGERLLEYIQDYDKEFIQKLG